MCFKVSNQCDFKPNEKIFTQKLAFNEAQVELCKIPGK